MYVFMKYCIQKLFFTLSSYVVITAFHLLHVPLHCDFPCALKSKYYFFSIFVLERKLGDSNFILRKAALM